MPLDLATNPLARPDRPRWRLGLAPSMALIALLAVALALIKVATEGSAECLGFLFLVSLLVGTLGLIVRRDRAPWVGFTLFGWVYALVALVPPLQALLQDKLPSEEIVDRLVISHLHPIPPALAYPLGFRVVRHEGRYYKWDAYNQPTLFQPTPEEVRQIDAYSAQSDDRAARIDASNRARSILYACSGLAFALLGAIAGRVLSDQARPADLRPSPQSG